MLKGISQEITQVEVLRDDLYLSVDQSFWYVNWKQNYVFLWMFAR